MVGRNDWMESAYLHGYAEQKKKIYIFIHRPAVSEYRRKGRNGLFVGFTSPKLIGKCLKRKTEGWGRRNEGRTTKEKERKERKMKREKKERRKY